MNDIDAKTCVIYHIEKVLINFIIILENANSVTLKEF